MRIYAVIMLVFLYSCNNKTKDNSIKVLKNVIKPISVDYDTLRSGVNVEFDSSDLIVFKNFEVQLNNTDKGLDIDKFYDGLNSSFLMIYSVPTGRMKIINVSSNSLKESEWFDNDASGDSILLNTLENNRFEVIDNLTNQKYCVQWLSKFNILTPERTDHPLDKQQPKR
jgi:hypothetical protein